MSILSEARRAIRWGQSDYLSVLFALAAEKTNIDLRLALYISEIDEIEVKQQDGCYQISLTPDQFKRVQQNTRSRHVYRVKPEQQPDPGGFNAAQWNMWEYGEYQ
jgi:hypothetical protein